MYIMYMKYVYEIASLIWSMYMRYRVWHRAKKTKKNIYAFNVFHMMIYKLDEHK